MPRARIALRDIEPLYWNFSPSHHPAGRSQDLQPPPADLRNPLVPPYLKGNCKECRPLFHCGWITG